MKNTLPLLLLFLFQVIAATAQFNEQQLVSVDYENENAMSRLSVVPDSYWPEREYCFDSINGRYIFTGQGLHGLTMHIVDVQTGEVINQFGIPADNNAQGTQSFEYHKQFDRIYTLRPTNSNGLGVDLYQVNPEDGSYAFIATIDNSISWNNVVVALDDINDIYYMLHTNAQTIFKIDIIEGIVLDSRVIEGYFFNHMEWDSVNEKLVVLGKGNGAEFMNFADIDPVNLVLSNPRTVDGLVNTTTGLTQGNGFSTMDPKQQLFFQIASINGNKLLVIDLSNGEILHSIPFMIGPNFGPDFMVKHSIEKFVYDTKNDQLLGLIRGDLLPTGIVNIQMSRTEVFPNPVNDWLKVNWEKEGNFRFEIINSLGQKVITKYLASGDRQHILNCSELEKGTYFLLLQDGQGITAVQKFQKL